MAELERKDIISDDALQAPAVLVNELEKVVAILTRIRDISGKTDAGAKSATSFKQVTDSVKLLVDQDKELVKVQNQLASSLAKNNDEYANMKKKVDEANAAVKTRVELGERDAHNINRTNASLKELQAALAKNRQEYAKLSNEQARSSKEGQKLLKTIQQQDKDIKTLNVSMGKHQDNVGNYASAMEGLDGATGGVVTRLKMMGQQLLALLSNPIVALIAAIVAGFVALKSAATTFYTTTADGEERLKQHQATWDAFFLTLSKGWASVGKAVDDFLGEDGLKGMLTFFIAKFAPSMLGAFVATEKQAQKLREITSQLIKDHAADVVDDANTELKANKLIEISRNKLDYSAEKRMAALKEHNRIKEEQLKGDIQLAQDDLDAFDKRIKLERVGGKLLEEDITKRAQLEAALIKVQSDASAARTGFLKLEKALADEIHQDKINALNAEFDKSIALKQAEVDKAIALVQKEVIEGRMIKADGDKKIADIRLGIADDLIQAQIDGLNKLLLSEELTAEERAAIEVRLAKLKVDLNNALYNQVITLDEAVVTSGKSTTEKLYDIYSDFTDALGSLLAGIGEARIQSIDEEIAKLEESTQKQLELVGDNEAQKKVIEDSAEARREQLEKKKRAEQTRQAKFDKASAAIASAINTKLAYTAALAHPPGPPTTIPNAILAGVLGAIQTAAILAQPIPQFFKGTNNSPEGLAMVGEKGTELKITPSGKMSLTPDVPTIDYLKAGTKIIPHDETMKMLALSGLGKDLLMQREQNQQIELAQSLKQIEKNTRKLGKSTSTGNLFKQGILTYEQKIKEDKSREYIRRSNLGY